MNTKLRDLRRTLERALAKIKAEFATDNALRNPTPENLKKAKAAIEAAEDAKARSSPA